MKLGLTDRLTFESLFAKTDSMNTREMVQDIRGKVSISKEEKEKINLRLEAVPGPGGRNAVTVWKWDEDVEPATIKFSRAETSYLKGRVDALDKEEKIGDDILPLCRLIRNVKDKK